MTDPTAAIRIANCSGFYGDRLAALHEQVTGGPVDVVTGDYLAELTMLILGRDRMRETLLDWLPAGPIPARHRQGRAQDPRGPRRSAPRPGVRYTGCCPSRQ